MLDGMSAIIVDRRLVMLYDYRRFAIRDTQEQKVFGLFRRKPSLAEARQNLYELALLVDIYPALEAGNYAAFIVDIDEMEAIDDMYVQKYFSIPSALEKFVATIDSRISNGDFLDPGADLPMVKEMRELSGWKPNINAQRIALGPNKKLLFKW